MRKLLLSLIAFYQKVLSPMKSTRCPYIPSCSAYGAEAIRRHGAVIGTALAFWRIIRCNPLSSGGYDPVPAQLIRPRSRMYPYSTAAENSGKENCR
ncbi:MAG: membrane protein insertion efficiency factor YidD [Lachnospiraceae bacterium]|nr:membrane protein insertion efficiency factor YidD [Lachnospiraceae bacterium]